MVEEIKTSSKRYIVLINALKGGLFGYFIMHPLVAFVTTFMHLHVEEGRIHLHVLIESLPALWMAFSPDMILWALSFTLFGVCVGAYYGLILDRLDHIMEETALEMQKTQFTVDHAHDPIFLTDPDGSFSYVNAAACRSLGYSKEELLSMRVYDIVPDFTKELWSEIWEKVKNEGSIKHETQHRRKDGTIFPVKITANYLKYEDREQVFAFVHNITI